MEAPVLLTSKLPQLGKALQWAGVQTERIAAERQGEVGAMLWGYDVQAVSYTMYLALQETMADRLRTTMPKLAGAGMGFELWRLLVRGHEAPEQTLIQRAHRQRWSFPPRCKDLSELRVRLPEWECWGRDLEAETGAH